MTACNARPSEGHPFHGTGVACYLPASHLDHGEAHSWDIEAAAERHERLSRSLTALRERFPERSIARFDVQPARPLMARDMRTGEESPITHLPAGPWLIVVFDDGDQFAVWKTTGDVYRVGSDGAVEDDPVIEGSA